MTLVCGFRNLSFPSKSRVRQQNGFYTQSGQTKFPTKFPSKFHCLFLAGSNAEDKLLIIQDATISGMLTFQHFCSNQSFLQSKKKKKKLLFHLHLFVERLYHPYIHFTKAAYLVQLVLSFTHKQPHMYGRR